MALHTTQQAIQAATNALHAGVTISLLKQALIQDGFTSQKASVIIRWANKMNTRSK
jgi:flagellar biosynthesis/type III secretory pathway M-ring protein FliF/YscJ